MDDLVPQAEEFCTIETHIDEGMQVKLCRIYVERTMHPASLSVFDDLMLEGSDVKCALYRAVVNQSVIEALVRQLNTPDQPIHPFNI